MKGNNIYIRILEREDMKKIYKWFNDEEIGDIMGYLPVFRIENQLKYYENSLDDKARFVFAICTHNDEHIGNVGLGKINYVSRNCMLNIFIADHKNRNKGFGSEAIKLVLRFAFNKLNMHKVYLQTSDRFEGAVHMYERLGFYKEGVMRDHYYSNGRYDDKIIFSILKNEFYDENEKYDSK